MEPTRSHILFCGHPWTLRSRVTSRFSWVCHSSLKEVTIFQCFYITVLCPKIWAKSNQDVEKSLGHWYINLRTSFCVHCLRTFLSLWYKLCQTNIYKMIHEKVFYLLTCAKRKPACLVFHDILQRKTKMLSPLRPIPFLSLQEWEMNRRFTRPRAFWIGFVKFIAHQLVCLTFFWRGSCGQRRKRDSIKLHQCWA